MKLWLHHVGAMNKECAALVIRPKFLLYIQINQRKMLNNSFKKFLIRKNGQKTFSPAIKLTSRWRKVAHHYLQQIATAQCKDFSTSGSILAALYILALLLFLHDIPVGYPQTIQQWKECWSDACLQAKPVNFYNNNSYASHFLPNCKRSQSGRRKIICDISRHLRNICFTSWKIENSMDVVLAL